MSGFYLKSVLDKAVLNKAILNKAVLQVVLCPVLRLVLCCSLLLFPRLVIATTELQEARAWRAPDHLRVVLDFAQPFTYDHFFLQQPHRLVINLPHTRRSAQFVHSVRSLEQHQLIQAVRHADHDHFIRVVFDLNHPVTTEPFTLEPQGDYGHRLVFDLYHHLPVIKPAVPRANRSVAAHVFSDIDTLLQHRRDIVIVVDPGHGGEDPGALGYDRIKEKDLVLALSQKLQKAIDQQQGFQAVLTRSGDYYVGLQRRAQLARKHGADLFVSIHANSFVKNRTVRGAIVFALSDRGATSAMGRWMEKAENDADLVGGMRQANLPGRPRVLREVLLDLSMTATLAKSMHIGADLLHHMQQLTRLHSANVEQANFVVLRSPDIPSLLVEVGFISNREEAKKLKQQAYQQKMARQIAQGITRYFQQNPPAGTLLAWKKNKARQPAWHQVKTGETLSHLAVRYNIKVDEIKQMNDMQDDLIRPGQTLKMN